MSPCKFINEMVSAFLLSLLEGKQKERVVTRLLSMLEWKHIGSHLQAVQFIMQMKDDTLRSETKSALDIEVQATQERLKKLDADKRGTWKPPSQKEMEQLHRRRVQLIRSQLKLESFRFITIIQKLASFRFDFDKVAVRANIELVLADANMMNFFRDRLGEVEVVREGTDALEMHYFPLPDERMDQLSHHDLLSNVNGVLDQCNRADPIRKLQEFLEGVQEIIQTIRKPDNSHYSLRDIYMALESRDPKLYLSVLITLILIASFDRNSTMHSLDSATFGRMESAYTPFLLLGGMHLFITLATFYSFVQIRVPVIRYMRLHRAKLDMMKLIADGHSANAERDGLDNFKKTAVYVTGVKHGIAADEIRPIFQRYGIVTAVRSPIGASWAVVCYLGGTGVDKCVNDINNGKRDMELCELEEDGSPNTRGFKPLGVAIAKEVSIKKAREIGEGHGSRDPVAVLHRRLQDGDADPALADEGGVGSGHPDPEPVRAARRRPRVGGDTRRWVRAAWDVLLADLVLVPHPQAPEDPGCKDCYRVHHHELQAASNHRPARALLDLHFRDGRLALLFRRAYLVCDCEQGLPRRAKPHRNGLPWRAVHKPHVMHGSWAPQLSIPCTRVCLSLCFTEAAGFCLQVSYSFAGFGGGGGAGLGPWLQQPEFPEEVSELSDNVNMRTPCSSRLMLAFEIPVNFCRLKVVMLGIRPGAFRGVVHDHHLIVHDLDHYRCGSRHEPGTLLCDCHLSAAHVFPS